MEDGICLVSYKTSHQTALLRYSHSSVCCTLRQNHTYLFHVQPVQMLQPGAKHLRLQASEWVFHKIVCRVLSTVKAIFTGSVAQSVCLADNLHTTRYFSFQQMSTFGPESCMITQSDVMIYRVVTTEHTVFIFMTKLFKFLLEDVRLYY
jgi:hypothetical protein